MAQTVTWNGTAFSVPDPNDTGWGPGLTSYLVALPAGALQKTGGLFTLAADVDFGASFGLKSSYYKSRSSNVASAGILRGANTENLVAWRNAANNADLALSVNASNQLIFNGVAIQSTTLTSAHILVGNASNVATDVAMSGHIAIDNTGATTIQSGVITNAMVNASAAIAYSKLNLTGSVLNADISASAAIAASKLAALTVSRAVVSDGSGFLTVAATTATEIGYVNGVTSAIQTQINLLAPKASPSFTGQILSADGGVGSPTYSFTSEATTGLYKVSTNVMGIAVGGRQVAKFGLPGASSDGTSATGLTLTNNSAIAGFNQQSTVSVTTSATTILTVNADSCLVFVTGDTSGGGNIFCDLLWFGNVGASTVISAFTSNGSPAARTYSNTGGALKLTMASGTYNINVFSIELQRR